MDRRAFIKLIAVTTVSPLAFTATSGADHDNYLFNAKVIDIVKKRAASSQGFHSVFIDGKEYYVVYVDPATFFENPYLTDDYKERMRKQFPAETRNI